MKELDEEVNNLRVELDNSKAVLRREQSVRAELIAQERSQAESALSMALATERQGFQQREIELKEQVFLSPFPFLFPFFRRLFFIHLMD
jgi:hypothetical protein